jgi:hypothetical protein
VDVLCPIDCVPRKLHRAVKGKYMWGGNHGVISHPQLPLIAKYAFFWVVIS